MVLYEKGCIRLRNISHNLFLVKLLAYLIHNCCIKIRVNYKRIDKLFSSFKILQLKIKQTLTYFLTLLVHRK